MAEVLDSPMLEKLCDDPNCPIADLPPDEFWAVLGGFRQKCRGSLVHKYEVEWQEAGEEVVKGSAQAVDCSEVAEPQFKTISVRDIF